MRCHRFILAALLFMPIYGYCGMDSECDDLKALISSGSDLNSTEKTKLYAELDRLIADGSNCAKNQLGRIYFEGKLVQQDKDHGYAIFYDLSEKGYPPAQFNLAYALTEMDKTDPEVPLRIMEGIIAKYPRDEDYNYLVEKATVLGRKYIQKLRLQNNPRASELNAQFENAVRELNHAYAQSIHEKTKQSKAVGDALSTLIMIGGAVATAGMRGGSGSIASGSSSVTQYHIRTLTAPTPRFYQLYSPAGQGLYAVPIM